MKANLAGAGLSATSLRGLLGPVPQLRMTARGCRGGETLLAVGISWELEGECIGGP